MTTAAPRWSRGAVAALSGGISVTIGVVALIVEEPVLAVVAGAAGAVAGGLALDLARHRPFEAEGVDPFHDPETGLFTEAYFQVALAARVAAARRGLRPLSVAIVEVEHGAGVFAPVVGSTLREADTPCLLDRRRVALILEDTPEDGAVWAIERLRRNADVHEDEVGRVWAGVASYPSHGLDTVELAVAAQRALELARDWGSGRIEVAPEA